VLSSGERGRASLLPRGKGDPDRHRPAAVLVVWWMVEGLRMGSLLGTRRIVIPLATSSAIRHL